ncbi:MAG: hypothetical protein KGL02_06045 [Acidobacteriota bacterium]|nr:hypothetical protein [Acidobacteriota bacterium]MDE3168747.1 hypothetical protein [Acidobacteriota bacterium]
MKKLALASAVLLLAGLAAARPKPNPDARQVKLVMARQSTVDPVEILKHLGEKCPNVTITTNPRHSDYMLYAGWGGNYRLMIIKHGGDTIFATETVLLSNAVKNVCRFLDSQPAQTSAPPAPPAQQ